MSTETKLKQELIYLCHEFVENRQRVVRHKIQDIQNSLTSETKSSAGDKHETGRAMLQLEREKTGRQLAEIEKLQQILSKIDPSATMETAALGSIVFTEKANYFIAISAGELLWNEQRFYAISLNTPMAKLLFGKRSGEVVAFRGQDIPVLQVI